MEKRPDFETLASYEEFKKYYWYRKELSGICRRLGIEYKGTKQELNHHIEEYFCGKLAESKEGRRQIVYHAGYAGCILGEIGLCKV